MDRKHFFGGERNKEDETAISGVEGREIGNPGVEESEAMSFAFSVQNRVISPSGFRGTSRVDIS